MLSGLGWEPTGSKGEESPAAEAAPEALYCNFCWSTLPPGAEECADCGRSVAEMEAARTRLAELDSRWVPPSKGGQRSKQDPAAPRVKRWEPPLRAPVEEVPPAPAPAAAALEPEYLEEEEEDSAAFEAVTAPAAAPRRKVRAAAPAEPAARAVRYLVIGVSAATLLAGAGAGGFWFALHLSPKPKPTSQAIGTDGRALVPAVAANGVRLEFKNPYPELHVVLCTADGKVLMSSADIPPTGDTRVEPGEYRYGILENQARWRGPVRSVKAVPGEVLQLAPPPAVAADYYLWLGKRLHAAGNGVDAEVAWRKAIAAYPGANEARIQLAAYRAVHFDYREAKALAKEVLRRSPGHPQATHLLATLAKLETSH